MMPVLRAIRDQVVFFKHNLNARAISLLKENADQIQNDVEKLVREMESSIKEANLFIEQVQVSKQAEKFVVLSSRLFAREFALALA